jgi:hypothetical protein
MSDKCPVRLRVVFVALALVITIIVNMPLPASAGSYESCLGSCAIGSSANSPACIDRRAQCSTDSSGSQRRAQGTAYGAIAYSISKDKVGFSHDYNSIEAAERRAVSECRRETGGAGDCKSEIYFVNSCGAIASGDDDIILFGINKNQSLAIEAALSSCQRNGGKNCQLIGSHCSPP